MIKYTKDTNNIVTLTLDMSNRTENLFNHEIGQAFVPVLEHLQNEKAKGQLKGVILTSAKSTFLASGDLEYLYQATDPQNIFDFSERMKFFLRALEYPSVPVVSAINGDALSIGFELTLATHHRIVVDNPNIKLGLPEISIGMIPGNGGIIRLMWILGIEKAYEVLAKGLIYSPKEALKEGLIDNLAANTTEMIHKAKQWILNSKDGYRDWDKPGHQIPGGTAHSASVARFIRSKAAQIAARTKNNYPAYSSILEILSEGSKVDFDTASTIDSRIFTRLLIDKACKNMIKAFWFDRKAINSGISRPKGFGKFRPKKVGIIGAGQMGSRIAYACLKAGLEVVIKDVSKLIAERGRDYLRDQLSQKLNDGIIDKTQFDNWLKQLTTTDNSKEFETCDLVIEAVFENQMLKQKVTREAELYLDEYAILGTNSISIPISQMASATQRPENYVGLHFFHPADIVPMVEIVKGNRTSDETIARAIDFVRKLDKTPIVVKDDWGFYAARVQNTYILEGITLLQEGYPSNAIENLGLLSGMSKPPLELADELGLGIVLKYEHQAASHYGNQYIQHPAVNVLSKMIMEHNRSGKIAKNGFYNYTEKQRLTLWEGLSEYFPIEVEQIDQTILMERLLFAQVVEALWCIQEGVIQSVQAANLGSIYGWGFPSFKGGVIQFINDYGSTDFIERCKHFEKLFGPRFKLTKALRNIITNFTFSTTSIV